MQLYKDRESLDKKVKKVDKEKKKFVEEISKRNRISDSISHTAFNQHAQRQRDASRDLKHKEERLAQQLKNFSAQKRRIVESKRELSRLRVEDSSKRMSFVDDINSFYKKRVFDKH